MLVKNHELFKQITNMRPHGKDENGNPVDTCDMTDPTNLCDGSYFENQEECKANCPKHSLFIDNQYPHSIRVH